MAINKRIIQWSIRLLILAISFFMVLGGPILPIVRKVLPGLSPLTVFNEAVMQQTLYASIYWFLPPFLFLLLAVFKGRFFCQNLCPLGTLYALPKQILKPIDKNKVLNKKIMPIRLNAFLFWMTISGAVFGWPFILCLDPLSTFSRLGIWREAIMWIPGGIIPLMFLFSFFQSQMWCTHLCPLGYCFDIFNKKIKTFSRDRRQLIAGLAIGGAVAFLPKITKCKSKQKNSILPPGAIPEFAEACTRCYACVAACELEVIRVKTGGNINEWFMPELTFDYEACDEFCTDCTQACPTGAIQLLSEKEKRHRKIGEAHINKKACLTWEDNEDCMVCHEYCPYSAIEIHTKKNDIACPIMIPDLCRGCGACENNCPAEREGKAIIVSAITPQTIITIES